ncbi:4-alpha-N-acetylgalactosaminyltransferase [compost metagenome]
MDKNIILFIDSLRAGGAERVCVNLANSLSKKGIAVKILVMNYEQYGCGYKVSEKIEIVDLKCLKARHLFIPLLKYLYRNPANTIICFNYELTILLSLLRKFIPNVSFKLVARNINSLSKLFGMSQSMYRKRIVLPLLKWSYRNSDVIVNQCIAMKDEIDFLIPSCKGKSTYIYNIVNQEIQDFNNEVINEVRSGEPYLLYVGRLEPQKGLHDLILAFHKVVTYYPDLRLKIVGIGRLEDELRRLVYKLKLENQIDFEGFQFDLLEFYLNAKAVVLTSQFEGFPNVLVESISLGTPVISYDCCHGPREIINSANGYLVEMNNIEQFSSAIGLLLNNKFDHEKIRNDAKDKYFEHNVINKWIGVL